MDKKLAASFAHWDIPRDFAEPMANYLEHGWSPGGFMTALLANDCWRAVASAHHAVQMDHVRNLVRWIINAMPSQSRGSYDAVEAWTRMNKDARRKILEDQGIIMSMWDHLRDTGD